MMRFRVGELPTEPSYCKRCRKSLQQQAFEPLKRPGRLSGNARSAGALFGSYRPEFFRTTLRGSFVALLDNNALKFNNGCRLKRAGFLAGGLREE